MSTNFGKAIEELRHMRNHVISVNCWFWTRMINREAIEISKHIEATAKYWTQYLSIFFGAAITMLTYQQYMCFFVGGIPWEQRYLFIHAWTQLVIFLFLLIEHCSRVVKFNQTFEKQNREFGLLFNENSYIKANHSLLLKVYFVI